VRRMEFKLTRLK